MGIVTPLQRVWIETSLEFFSRARELNFSKSYQEMTLGNSTLHAVNAAKHVIAGPWTATANWAPREIRWQLPLKSRVVGGLSLAPSVDVTITSMCRKPNPTGPIFNLKLIIPNGRWTCWSGRYICLSGMHHYAVSYSQLASWLVDIAYKI